MQEAYEKNLFKLCILLDWVGVVKSHYQCALECLLIVLVQQCSLCMTNVQIPEDSCNTHCNNNRYYY